MSINACIVRIGNRGERHDPGIVDQHIDSAERRLGGIEHPPYRVRIADVGLCRQRSAAGLLDLVNQRLGRCGTLRVVDNDGEAITRQPFGNS